MGRVPRIGVLGLQGDFACHRASLEALGVEAIRVVLPEDLADCDALVMPGGESTTMTRLMERNGLRPALERFVREKPVLGTCAGVILLSKRADHLPSPPLGVLDVTTERNAYGRQIDSFSAEVMVPPLGGPFHGVFIRAPRLREVGAGVEVIAWRGEEPVGVRQGRCVGICFHPELTSDLRLHRWVLTEVAGLSLAAATAGANVGGA
ncbi:MAG TPA: pyridoxal 5'-phosphate synthase glutaminase subunit PdxT [Candidatus Sulfotelmatobacter sp.]|nr:pyridoxal 5'-phosphate synthase glutaminase subunit PdxT [Candidatus Sulfotelmatobacter sp.]